jgi:hypothetical protein
MTTSSTVAALAFVGTVLMAGCGSDATAPDDSVTPSATTLLSVIPQGGTTDIAPDDPFSFTFDGAMMSGTEGYVDLHRGGVTGPVHPMSCAWSADRARLTCTPGPHRWTRPPGTPSTWVEESGARAAPRSTWTRVPAVPRGWSRDRMTDTGRVTATRGERTTGASPGR